jgi:hypothetical protein
VRELARALGDGVAGSSRIHDAFTKPRLPDWGLLDVLVAELARRTPDTDEAAEVKRFHSLWDAAALSDHLPTPVSEKPESSPTPATVDAPQRTSAPSPDVRRLFSRRRKGGDSLVRERMRFSLEFATPREREQLRWAVENRDGDFMRALLLRVQPRLEGTSVFGYIEYVNDSVNEEAEALAHEFERLDAMLAKGREIPNRYEPAPDSAEARTAEEEASAWSRAALASATKKEIKKLRAWAKSHPPYGEFSDLAQDLNSRLPRESRLHINSSYPGLWEAIATEFKREDDEVTEGFRSGRLYY